MAAPTLADVFETIRGFVDAFLPGNEPLQLIVKMRSGPAFKTCIPHQPTRPAACILGRNVRHSADFRSVHWSGEDYQFTATQAAAIKALWEAWEAGAPELSQATILERAGSETERLRDLFRDHPAWGVFVVSGSSKGSYRLSPN